MRDRFRTCVPPPAARARERRPDHAADDLQPFSDCPSTGERGTTRAPARDQRRKAIARVAIMLAAQALRHRLFSGESGCALLEKGRDTLAVVGAVAQLA